MDFFNQLIVCKDISEDDFSVFVKSFKPHSCPEIGLKIQSYFCNFSPWRDWASGFDIPAQYFEPMGIHFLGKWRVNKDLKTLSDTLVCFWVLEFSSAATKMSKSSKSLTNLDHQSRRALWWQTFGKVRNPTFLLWSAFTTFSRQQSFFKIMSVDVLGLLKSLVESCWHCLWNNDYRIYFVCPVSLLSLMQHMV